MIEKQIEEAANFLAHSKTMKNRDRDTDRAFSALLAACGRLLEIVQNQQRQIEELQKMKSEFDDLMSGFKADEEYQRELILKAKYKEGEL